MASFPRPARATLLRRFTLLSLGTTILVGVVFGVITGHLVENFALRRQARTTADHVLEVTRSRLVVEDFLSSSPARRSQFERAIRDLPGKTDIIHVTVWGREGEALYSDDRLKSKPTVPAEPYLKLALVGQLQWQLVGAREGSQSNAPLLEVFVPVVVAGIPHPVAVYQVRSDLADLAPALARLIWSV